MASANAAAVTIIEDAAHVRLSSGALMPMLAIGTGRAPASLGAAASRRGRMQARSSGASTAMHALLNMSISIGYRHIDTSEVYAGFDQVGAALRELQATVGGREHLFITSKVDPTRRRRRTRHQPVPPTACEASGAGCFVTMAAAANSTVQRLGTYADLLLLHRPPRREGSDEAQCARLRESWRALEDAQMRGLTRAIGLSNICAPLLRCLAAVPPRIAPAVLQYMQHVGMGSNPNGYRSWARRQWGAVYMAYSVLGGVEGDFARITSASRVQEVASAHRTGGANIALSWVAQLGMPLVVLSGSPGHLRDDLRLFDVPPWGKLSASEMETLSRLREPAGRPSHWGDCADDVLE